jgi:pimeloyl-ACP methyl ester carboxylesterase
MYRLRSAIFIAVIISIFLGIRAAPALTQPATTYTRGDCTSVHIPTTIASGIVSIYGELCTPFGTSPHTIQLLVHGGTYNHSYWDFPGFEGRYSYVQAASSRGYATLAIDRLGYGQSTRPVSQDVTYNNEVLTLHAVVQALRSGSLGIHVQNIEAIGHSLGSGDVVGDAAAYPQDFNAIILTGYGQTVSPTVAQLNALYMEPANYLQRFSSLDTGYETSKPDSRSLSGLYYMPLANPAVVATDQATEDTVTKTELSSRPQGGTVTTNQITVPVLLADGRYDSHYCLDNAIGQPPHVGSNCASAQAFWNSNASQYSNACLSTVLLQSGHDVNLHVTAPESFRLLLNWSWVTVPPFYGNARCAHTGALPSS